MNKIRLKSLTAILMVFFHLSMAVLSTMPRMGLAQTKDIDPPTIDFEAIAKGITGDKQVFAATVIDDVAVQSVQLFYRFGEDMQYLNRDMTLLGSSGIYTATLDSVEVPKDTKFIQYYLEAADGAGNRSLQGFAFDPLERELVSATAVPVSSPNEPIATNGLSLNKKILFGAIGILVLGVLASSSGGSGGASAAGVPVTVVVDQLP